MKSHYINSRAAARAQSVPMEEHLQLRPHPNPHCNRHLPVPQLTCRSGMEVTTRQGKKGPPQSSTCSPRKVLYYTNKAVEMGPSALSAITKLHPIKSGPWEGCCRNTLKSAWNYWPSKAQFCSSNKNSHVSPSTFTLFLQDMAVYHTCLQASGHHAYGETGCSFTSCSLTIPKNTDGLRHKKPREQGSNTPWKTQTSTQCRSQGC